MRDPEAFCRMMGRFRKASEPGAPTLAAVPAWVITECPQCMRAQAVDAYRTLDVVADPSLKGRLLARELTAHSCARCRHRYQVVYDALYTDGGRKLAVIVAQSELARRLADAAELHAGQQRRLVQTWEQLVEKVLIFDAGLDDRLVEIAKIGVCQQLVARYGDFLQKIGESQFNIAGVFFYRVDRSPPHGESVEFLLVLPRQPMLFSLKAPLAPTLREAEAHRVRIAGPDQSPQDWSDVSPRWTLRALADTSVAVGDVQVLVDPQIMLDPVANAFLASGPSSPPGSRRPLSVPAAESRRSRPQHYHFAHHRLRGAFADPENWVGALHSPDKDKILRGLWDEVTAACANDGHPTPLRSDGIKVHTARIQLYRAAIVEMTPPTGYGEAYFVALVLRRFGVGGGSISEIPMLAYYTLELGEDEDGLPCTYFCEWKEDGSRNNFGRGPAPILEDFVEALAARVRETALMKNPVPSEVVRG
ncbi:MAG: CpXC domain-containing protein [Gemmatimonadaceae bacterium]